MCISCEYARTPLILQRLYNFNQLDITQRLLIHTSVLKSGTKGSISRRDFSLFSRRAEKVGGRIAAVKGEQIPQVVGLYGT